MNPKNKRVYKTSNNKSRDW